MQGSVYGYELDKGAITMRFANLHESLIISMAYLPEQDVLVTSTVDSGGTVSCRLRGLMCPSHFLLACAPPRPSYNLLSCTSMQVWRIAGGEAHRFKQIGTSSVTVNFMATDEGRKHLMTASSDGSVTLWSVESLLPIYKMKLAGPASIPTFFSNSRFYLFLDSDVKIFSIRNLYVSWMDGNSECTSLKQLSFGLILAGERQEPCHQH